MVQDRRIHSQAEQSGAVFYDYPPKVEMDRFIFNPKRHIFPSNKVLLIYSSAIYSSFSLRLYTRPLILELQEP